MKPASTMSIDFENIFQSIPNLYIVVSTDFTIVGANDAYLQAIMVTKEELIGRNLFEVFTTNNDPDNEKALINTKNSLLRILSTGEGDSMSVVKYSITKKDGSGLEERYWSVLCAPIFDKEGKVRYIAQRVEDVTAFIQLKQNKKTKTEASQSLSDRTKRMEAEIYLRAQEISDTNRKLEQANEQLALMYEHSKELDNLKMQFFANVSHELRTPLALIIGPVTKLMSSTSLSNEEKLELEVIERNARLLLKQVNDILDVAKLEAGEISLEYTNTNLAQLMKEIASNFHYFAKEREVNFIIQAPDDLNSEVDIDKIERILLNLLSNAFKFTPINGVVELSLYEEEGKVIFCVSDSGPGIPVAMREVIFERFRQLDGSSRRNVGGTGLGLAIVKEFVLLHGGSVEVDSSKNGGAVFKVTLPIKISDKKDSKELPNIKYGNVNQSFITELSTYIPKQRVEPIITANHGALILIVEDNPDMNDFLCRILAKDYRIEVAYNGKVGLDKALQHLPDLIVSDVMMPEMTGDEMVKALFAQPQTRDIPVLMLSAKIDDKLKLDMLKAGVHDYIGKPFSADELCAKVEKLVDERRKKIAENEVLIEKLKISNQELERFAYVASHDLKSPLRAIDNLSQWIEEDLSALEKDSISENMTRLRKQIRLMERLLDSVLQYSLIEYKLEDGTQLTDLNTVVSNVVNIIAPPKGFKIKIAANTSQSLDIHSVPLQQALSNLVQNAIKHHDKEFGIIEVGLQENETHYIFKVQDDGPGIPEEYHDKIFNMFQTLKPRSQTGGTGIGLALVKKIVSTYGGEITVKSEPGSGSIFHFTWKKVLLRGKNV